MTDCGGLLMTAGINNCFLSCRDDSFVLPPEEQNLFMIMAKTRGCILFLSQHFRIKHEVVSLLLPAGLIY